MPDRNPTFINYQKWICYFQNRIIMFCLPVPTLIYMWEVYKFLGLVCLFCCMEICGPILGIYKLLTDTWMWKLGLRPHYFQKRNCMVSVQISTFTFLWAIYCDRFTYSQDRSAYSAVGKYVDRSWEYINRLQTHECGNWYWGRTILLQGIYKWDFRCSAVYVFNWPRIRTCWTK